MPNRRHGAWLLSAALVACRADDAPEPPPSVPTCGNLEVPTATGCTRVGVPEAECAGIGASDGEGGCSARVATCGAGSTAVLGTTDCAPVGAKCATCDAPTCPDGQVALPGEAACHAPSCGDVPTDALHVDGAAAAGGDGTAGKPFATIAAALALASEGAPTNIALAAGRYSETIDTPKPIRLFAACDAEIEGSVTLRGNAELHGVAITGASVGVSVVGTGHLVLLDRVRVHDTGGIGARVFDGDSQLTVRDSLFERATVAALYADGTKLVVERTVVRGTRPRASGEYGRGVHVQTGAELTMTGSSIEGSTELGVFVQGSHARLEDLVIRKSGLRGVHVQADRTLKKPASIELRRVGITGSSDSGVYLYAADATLEDVSIRDTRLDATGTFGYGIAALADEATGAKQTLTGTRVTIDGAAAAGVLARGTEVVLDGAWIRDVAPRADGSMGVDAWIARDPKSTARARGVFRGSLLEAAVEGLLIVDSDVRVERTMVRDTHLAANGKGGYGVDISRYSAPARLDVVSSIFERHPNGGIGSFGASLDIDGAWIHDIGVGESTWGTGVFVWPEDSAGTVGDATLRHVLIENTRTYGLHFVGSPVTLEHASVRDVRPIGDGTLGVGIGLVRSNALVPAHLVARASVVARSHIVGIGVTGSDLEASNLFVHHTVAGPDGGFGDGIGVSHTKEVPASASIRDSLLRDNVRGGLVSIGGAVSLARTTLACNVIDLDVEPATFGAKSYDATLTNGGDVYCGCGSSERCRAQSAKLGLTQPD